MIEWLITNHHYVPTLAVFSLTFVSTVIYLFLRYDDDLKFITISSDDLAKLIVIDVGLSSIMALFLIVSLAVTINSKPVGSAEWKTIYAATVDDSATPEISKYLTEDQKVSETASVAMTPNLNASESKTSADVKIRLDYDSSSAEAGDDIGVEFARIFSNLSGSESKTIYVTAFKSDYEKSKSFELSKDNLISKGDIVKSSKIVKVEIRTADYMETNLFGFKGRIDSYQPNEVRITIESDSNAKQEVDKIFE